MEDEEQNIHFKNLSVHRAATEEEALNLVRVSNMQIHTGSTLLSHLPAKQCSIVCGWHQPAGKYQASQHHQEMQSAVLPKNGLSGSIMYAGL